MLAKKKLYPLTLFLLSSYICSESSLPTTPTQKESFQNQPLIKKIKITGLSQLPEETILSSIPYKEGDIFDATLSSNCIKNLYKLDYFKQIHIAQEPLSDTTCILHITFKEKKPLKEITFNGNKKYSDKELLEKTDLDKKPTIDITELAKYERIIKNAYNEKNYHNAHVTSTLTHTKKGAHVAFTIQEGPLAKIKKVRFTGNKNFTGKKLRSLLFTREDWILGPMDKAGTYNPLAIEQDRYTIENFYQSNGFLHAKVGNATVTFDKKSKDIMVTFHIDEGKIYTLEAVNAPDNALATEEEQLAVIPLRPGQRYSKELIRMSLERLKTLYGKSGHIYADVEPLIHSDDTTQKVTISFYTDPGHKVFLNKINIFGNEKTRDHVIRRQLLFDEGDLLTTAGMEQSKDRVAQLGYFDLKEGVNWKINRLDDTTADLDLLVKEIKTGRFEFQANYGGNPNNLAAAGGSFSAQISAQERNLFGKGYQAKITGLLGGDQKSLVLNFIDPSVNNKPVRIGWDAYLMHSKYEEFKKIKGSVGEKRIGASLNLGFIAQKYHFITFYTEAGFEKIDHRGKDLPQVDINSTLSVKDEFQSILNERFKGGKFFFIQCNAGKDSRNHHMHPTHGARWTIFSRFAFPSFGDNVGFYKLQADAHWYTSLIGDYSLILHLHTHAGVVNNFSDGRIPFRELYNIGGQASVRGWQFGQIGPLWYVPDLVETHGWQGDPIGAKKAFFLNCELVFPITSDQSFKGSVFYDGGSGWDTPDTAAISKDHLKNNSFDYRHSIGIGIRTLTPQPMRVDWGFKLDRRTGETLNEVHFSTYFDF